MVYNHADAIASIDMFVPVGRRLVLMTSPMAYSAGAATLAAAPVRDEMIVLYRPGGQDVATDRALRVATIALTQRCIGNGSAVPDSF